MSYKRCVGRLVTTITLVLAVAACGDDASGPTMTRAQAKAQTESYIAQVVASLPQPVTTMTENDSDSFCFKNDAPSEEDGRVNIDTERKLPGVPLERHPDYFAAFRSQVESMGFKPTPDSALSAPSLFFTNNSNNFNASMTELGDADRTLEITFTSPCVWPNGAKPPKG
ncbi:hypothetical protein F7Q99_15965 [Streptomyces kaniharaensis]|uniref:Uncharacterized protein n=1 Tax=Streptomyces kaniharaensis TaxID=212423 RepID=A0A6N7KUR3_9ACTN|nr:hypothetical protein [Streptomyces kaniharaensis]MQS13724.1 hypothetical protein [Streptomyces kaniharaensis]